MKIVKKVLKYLVILIVLLIGAAIAAPFIFKDELIQMVKDEANNNLNAVVDFGEFELTLFESFPDFTFRIEQVKVMGIDTFAGVELANIGQLEFTLDLMSVIGGDNIKIKKFGLDNPNIQVKVLADGRANWDIAKASEDTVPEVDTASTDMSAFKLGVNEYYIRNANIIYDDATFPMRAELLGLTHEGKGDFTLDNFILKTLTTIDTTTIVYDGMRYLSKVKANIKADLDMDMAIMKFAFQENEIQLNELFLGIDGYVAMPTDDIEMDLKYYSKKTEFRSLLSMVPAVYTRDFASVQTSGKLGFDGTAKGIYNDVTYPAFGINLSVDNARFQYPDLPKAVENIQIKVAVKSAGGKDLDNMTIDVPIFHLEMAGNPVDMQLKLRTPMSDPDIDCQIKTQLVLQNIKDILPMEEGEDYNGTITVDLNLKGKMSSIDNEQYEDFTAEGQFSALDMNYSSKDMPYAVDLEAMYLNFSPQFVDMTRFDCKIGASDLSAQGRIDNMLAYVLKDEMLKGTLNISSNKFDLNELMGPEEVAEEAVAEGEEEPLTIIEVPGNIDFEMKARFGEVIYDDMVLKNMTGGIAVRDRVATLDNLKMNVIDGTLIVNGSYSTQNPMVPRIEFKYNIIDMDINEAGVRFNTIEKFAPVTQKCTGRFSTDLTMFANLDEQMEPVYKTMTGGGTVSTKSVKLNGFKPLEKIGGILKMDNLQNPTFKDLKIAFDFKDGEVLYKPFTINFGDGITAEISGRTNFDQEINYDMVMSVPRKHFGGQANGALEGLLSKAGSAGLEIKMTDIVKVDVKVTGTAADPKVTVDLKSIGETLVGGIKEQVKEQVKELIEEKKEEVKEIIKENFDAQKQKILADAQKQADQVKAQGKVAADKVRSEARAQSQKLVEEAKNPLAKKAAEIAAKKSVEEADKKAAGLEAEAAKQADAIMTKARAEADKLGQ